MRNYIEKICYWADSKGLSKYGTIDAQFEKIREEMTELKDAIYEFDRENDKYNLVGISHKIIDGIGDTFVTLIVAKYIELKNIESVQNFIYDYNMEKKIRLSSEDITDFLTTEYLELLHIKNRDNVVDKKTINSMIGTLYLTAKTYNVELLDCIKFAYNEIRDREGSMINGSFVKNGKKDKTEEE